MEIARAEDALQQRAVLYDRKGDRHYDYISAWIKATRGSDPDASLYYLAVMLEGGEDPRFIVRRMVILASEDIGNADPAALGVAVAAAQAVEHVGMPEAKFALAQAAIYLSLAPKSNMAGRALGAAQRHVREQGAAPVPGWLRSGRARGRRLAATTTRTTTPGISAPRSCSPRCSPAPASTSQTRPRRRWRSGWLRCAARGGDNHMGMSTVSTSAEETAPPQTLRARNPATGAILGSVQATAPEQVEQVVDAARKVQPLWALLRVEDRARYMRRVAQAIIDEFDELARLIGREQGRPRAEVASTELLAAIDALIWIADDGARVLGARRVGIHRSMALSQRARVAYEPFGVVGVIGAGSAPFAQPLAQIAGALLAGNGVVFKPARRACLTGERIMGVLARATLPEGLVRLVHGGTQVGVALARAPVDKVLFTGSPAVGRAVARACVSQEKEVTVELGGKDAMVVLADAHVAPCGKRRAVGRLRRRRPGARLDRARLRRARGRPSGCSRTSSTARGQCASATPSARACRWARSLPRGACSTCASWSRRPSRRARGCTAAAPCKRHPRGARRRPRSTRRRC